MSSDALSSDDIEKDLKEELKNNNHDKFKRKTLKKNQKQPSTELSKLRRVYNFIFRIKPPPPPPPKDETLADIIQVKATNTLVRVVAAVIASLISYAISYPLEIIKLHHQLIQEPRSKCISHGNYLCNRRRQKPQSVFNTARSLYLSKGFKRFYRGHKEAQIDNLYEAVFKFWLYENLQQLFKTNPYFSNHIHETRYLAGFLSAVCIVLVIYPRRAFRLNERLKGFVLRKHGSMVADSVIHRTENWQSYFRGSVSSILHLGPLYGFNFMIYNAIVEEMVTRRLAVHERQELARTDLLLAGGVTGLVSNIICHPMDLIRARMQSTALYRQHYRYEDTCRRYGQCILTILRKEGLYGFYKGIVPTLLRSAVNVGFQFAIFEKAKNWIQKFVE